VDFDFLDRQLFDTTRNAVLNFKQAVEGARPTERELRDLVQRIRSYPHSPAVSEDFVIGAVDGSGEFPVLQQDDIFMHFVVAAAATYKTATHRQHRLSAVSPANLVAKHYVLLSNDPRALTDGYRSYFDQLTGFELKNMVQECDYSEVFNAFGPERIRPVDVRWDRFPFAKASQIATHAYLLRSMAELGMAIRTLEQRPRYLLLDTSLVYFLLGDALYLPELMKRYLVTRANAQGTGIVGLCKSHNIPNGDLIGRLAKDERKLKDHWYLRLPAVALGEPVPAFLEGREIPPKLSVSYLFKFEATSFPIRLDVDAAWWKAHIAGDARREAQFFADLDFTCHEVRSYGYPYPMHAAHRSASLTKQERKALKDILLQQAQREGLSRGTVAQDPEELHMAGM
jgi:hypothetical protein